MTHSQQTTLYQQTRTHLSQQRIARATHADKTNQSLQTEYTKINAIFFIRLLGLPLCPVSVGTVSKTSFIGKGLWHTLYPIRYEA